MRACLHCEHWTDKARATAKGEHWCQRLNTWTEPGFECKHFAERLQDDASGDYYSVAEVAAMCHVHHTTVRYWIDTGRLKAYPVPTGKLNMAGQFAQQWRIDRAIADRYVEWYNSVVER